MLKLSNDFVELTTDWPYNEDKFGHIQTQVLGLHICWYELEFQPHIEEGQSNVFCFQNNLFKF